MIITALLFLVLSIPVIVISLRTLTSINSHGFYRFFSWEFIIFLFAVNYKYWFSRPFSINQIVSWIFLMISLYLVIAGIMQMKKAGKAAGRRQDRELYNFEKTDKLVTSGIFKYIRHPLYSSLLFLTWGIFLKNPLCLLLIPAALSTAFLILTALADEKECKEYFGLDYGNYMKNTTRFIPYLF
ncbi:MAG: methyltransferase [Marinilabiliaceae bacterium]|jgi:protein-S-isoprenylcysteine O-methyltransferase Ste14|nr:methyltransferase [Marinilabiliaceae bacterium]